MQQQELRDVEDEWLDEQPTKPVLLRPPTRVLVVEDDDNLRAVIAAQLRRGGYDVLLAASGEDAVAMQRIVRHEAPPFDALDLVVLDVHLPDRSGLEVFRLLRISDPHVRALFITAYPEPFLARAIAGLGAGLLAKPFSLEQLGHAAIGALLAVAP